jgi:Alcohol dehydrogenase GroES-associated
MRALCWHGKGDVRVDTVPDPKIQHPRDAIISLSQDYEPTNHYAPHLCVSHSHAKPPARRRPGYGR